MSHEHHEIHQWSENQTYEVHNLVEEDELIVEQTSYRTWRVINLTKETRYDVAYDPVRDRFICDCPFNSIHPQIPCKHIRATMKEIGYVRKKP